MNKPILNKQHPVGGFSLIELLVVMLLMSVIVSAVTLVVNPEGSFVKQLNKTGETLFQQMNYARDEALVLNATIGLDVIRDEQTGQAIELVWKRHSGYESATNQPTFATMSEPLTRFQLPDNMQWELTLDDTKVESRLDQLLAAEDENEIPEILFESSGDVTDFSLALLPSAAEMDANPDLREQRYLITLNPRGELAEYQVGVAAEDE